MRDSIAEGFNPVHTYRRLFSPKGFIRLAEGFNPVRAYIPPPLQPEGLYSFIDVQGRKQ